MDIAVVLRELDFEIEKLERIRAIVQSLEGPARRRATRPRTGSKTPAVIEIPAVTVSTEPKLIVVPPKKKREYQPRVRPLLEETRALAANIPAKPVFVPRSTLAKPVERQTQAVQVSPDALEATIRQKLLGVPAAGSVRHILAGD